MVKVSNGVSKTRGSSLVLLSQELFFVLFILAVVFIFHPVKTEAASFNVATGSGAINDGDSICQFEEAWTNVDYGARTYTDCVETGVYGVNDTINLPTGTITVGSGFNIDNSLKIVGHGRDASVISGDAWFNFYGSGVGDFTLEDFTIEQATVYESQVNSLVVEGIEFDGIDVGRETLLGIYNSNLLTVRNSYLHNTRLSGSGLSGAIDVAVNGENRTTNVAIENTTISHVIKGIKLFAGGNGLGDDSVLNATIKNTTITDLTRNLSGSGLAFYNSPTGIFVAGESKSGAIGTINYATINNTYSNIVGTPSGAGIGAAVRENTEDNDGNLHVNHTAQNDLYAVGGSGGSVNYSRGGDPSTFSTTSNGGNVSSDNSFSTYLTQPTDKHNQTSLASFLGVLSDNGGAVPTLALLEGSPAIDAGTNVAGLTTDARLAARPQGNAFDAGAYESAFSVASTSSKATLANTGQDSRFVAFTASLLTVGGAALTQARKLKNRAKFTISR